ncbi:MAG: aspartate carbamoyltransferase, partial [Moraxellaceae bacterium]|nr:aspartate carbamoyltransferase [Moraxellaceae bacterium]
MSAIRYTSVRVIDPAQNRDEVTSVAVSAEGKLLFGAAADTVSVDQVQSADGCWLTPAFVDTCARLREPGPRRHGTIASETRAARAAGFRHVAVPPDTDPVIDHAALAQQVIEKADHAGHTKVYPIGALTRALDGKTLASMGGLKAAG